MPGPRFEYGNLQMYGAIFGFRILKPIKFRDFGPRARSLYSDSLRAGRYSDRIPIGARLFVRVQTGPGAHSVSLECVPSLFPWSEKCGAWFKYSPLSSAEVEERVELYIYSTSGNSWTVLG